MAISVTRRTVLLIGLLTIGLGSPITTTQLAAEQETTRQPTKRVKPAYPELARLLKLSGKVKLGVGVTPEGKVKSVQVIGGHPILAAAASEAARQWLFEPAPKESSELLVFEFVAP